MDTPLQNAARARDEIIGMLGKEYIIGIDQANGSDFGSATIMQNSNGRLTLLGSVTVPFINWQTRLVTGKQVNRIMNRINKANRMGVFTPEEVVAVFLLKHFHLASAYETVLSALHRQSD
jgi:hypothetical protein